MIKLYHKKPSTNSKYKITKLTDISYVNLDSTHTHTHTHRQNQHAIQNKSCQHQPQTTRHPSHYQAHYCNVTATQPHHHPAMWLRLPNHSWHLHHHYHHYHHQEKWSSSQPNCSEVPKVPEKYLTRSVLLKPAKASVDYVIMQILVESTSSHVQVL